MQGAPEQPGEGGGSSGTGGDGREGSVGGGSCRAAEEVEEEPTRTDKISMTGVSVGNATLSPHCATCAPFPVRAWVGQSLVCTRSY